MVSLSKLILNLRDVAATTIFCRSSITFSLTMTSNFSYYPQSLSPVPTYNNITTINGVGTMSLYNTASSVIPLSGPCTADKPINKVQQNLQYFFHYCSF